MAAGFPKQPSKKYFSSFLFLKKSLPVNVRSSPLQSFFQIAGACFQSLKKKSRFEGSITKRHINITGFVFCFSCNFSCQSLKKKKELLTWAISCTKLLSSDNFCSRSLANIFILVKMASSVSSHDSEMPESAVRDNESCCNKKQRRMSLEIQLSFYR